MAASKTAKQRRTNTAKGKRITYRTKVTEEQKDQARQNRKERRTDQVRARERESKRMWRAAMNIGELKRIIVLQKRKYRSKLTNDEVMEVRKQDMQRKRVLRAQKVNLSEEELKALKVQKDEYNKMIQPQLPPKEEEPAR